MSKKNLFKKLKKEDQNVFDLRIRDSGVDIYEGKLRSFDGVESVFQEIRKKYRGL